MSQRLTQHRKRDGHYLPPPPSKRPRRTRTQRVFAETEDTPFRKSQASGVSDFVDGKLTWFTGGDKASIAESREARAARLGVPYSPSPAPLPQGQEPALRSYGRGDARRHVVTTDAGDLYISAQDGGLVVKGLGSEELLTGDVLAERFAQSVAGSDTTIADAHRQRNQQLEQDNQQLQQRVQRMHEKQALLEKPPSTPLEALGRLGVPSSHTPAVLGRASSFRGVPAAGSARCREFRQVLNAHQQPMLKLLLGKSPTKEQQKQVARQSLPPKALQQAARASEQSPKLQTSHLLDSAKQQIADGVSGREKMRLLSQWARETCWTRTTLAARLACNISNQVWCAARQHARFPGPGVTDTREPAARRVLSRAKIERFLRVLFCSVQRVAFGTKLYKLASGSVQEIAKLIRTRQADEIFCEYLNGVVAELADGGAPPDADRPEALGRPMRWGDEMYSTSEPTPITHTTGAQPASTATTRAGDASSRNTAKGRNTSGSRRKRYLIVLL